MKQSFCEVACPEQLACRLNQTAGDLSARLAAAEHDIAMAGLGFDIARHVADEAISEGYFTEEVAEMIGDPDDKWTTTAQTANRKAHIEPAISASNAVVQAVRNAATIQGYGPSDIELAGQLASLVEGVCDGPKRGFKIPLTNILVSLPAGRGELHCGIRSPGMAKRVRTFLGNMAARYSVQ